LLVEFLQRTRPLRRLFHWTGSVRGNELVERFAGLIQPNESVLDIGSGNCNICENLRARGIDITPLDVKNLSFVDSISPLIYDGRTIPFPDDRFEVGLLITVLHHTPDPDAILREAARVCKRLIIIEDIYSNRWHKYVTFTMDSLLNADFFDHPHTNKSDPEWRGLFDRLGLRILHAAYLWSFLVFRHATYHLERCSRKS
jgi:SAM-dependent methyltransferase